MPTYVVQSALARNEFNKVQQAIVIAADVADAKLVAQSQRLFDTNNPWINAVVTEIVSPDLSGAVLTFVINGNTFTQTFGAAQSIDALAALILTDIQVTYGTAIYTSATNIFNFPSGLNLGDKTFTMSLIKDGVQYGALLPTVDAEGAEATERNITLPADGAVVPNVASYT